MNPERIRLELWKRRKKVRQADIARACQVTRTTVTNVIDRTAVSERVMRAIAAAIGRTPEEVFPERFRAAGSTGSPPPVEDGSGGHVNTG